MNLFFNHIKTICLMLSLALSIPVNATTVVISSEKAEMAMVDINSATAKEISAAMRGVGPKKAEAIVAFREANGDFYTLEEVSQVKGIGVKTLEKNKDRVKVEVPK
jgi:competence protein ComEA